MLGIGKLKAVASRVVSPTFSLYCHYLPCTHTTDAAAGLIISSLPQSCTSKIAMKGAWQTTLDGFFRDNCIFHSFWKKNSSHSPSFYLLLFITPLPVRFRISDFDTKAETMKQTPLLFKSDRYSKSKEHHLAKALPAQHRSKCQNKNSHDPRHSIVSSGESKFTSRAPQKSCICLSTGVRNQTHTLPPNKLYSSKPIL